MLRLLAALLCAALQAQGDPTTQVSWTFTETTAYAGCVSSLGLPRLDRAFQPQCNLTPNLCPAASTTIVATGTLQWERLEPAHDFVVTLSFDANPAPLLPCAFYFASAIAWGMADANGYGSTTLLLPDVVPYSVLPQGATLFGHLQVVTFDSTASVVSSSNLMTIVASNP